MKDFDNWNIIKKKTEDKNRPNIKTGEIYWCRFGINIGTEYDGKNDKFLRPVIIIKKYSNETILILPLTTKLHTGDWYFNINIKNIPAQIVLNQSKTIDSKRLENKILSLPKNKLKEIINAFTGLIINDTK